MSNKSGNGDGPRQKATIYDVARDAGVTISTVSRAFSRPEMIGAKTRDRVIAVARTLNYRPSAFAGSLTTKRTLLIGLITADLRNPTVANLARGVQDTIRPRRYLPIVCSTGADPELEIGMLNEMFQRGVDGIIVTSSYGWMAKEVLTYFHTQADPDLPLVFIGRPIGMPDIDHVSSDAEAGGRMAVDHLVGLGHRDIGCLHGDLKTGVAPRRWKAFQETLASHDIAIRPGWTVGDDTTIEGGRRAMETILNRGTPPTAIFAINDLMAFGAMIACRARGLSIPRDISVIGFDDIAAAGISSPGLTTIAQPTYGMGEKAAELLLARIDDGTRPPTSHQMPCTLIPRETTAPPGR